MNTFYVYVFKDGSKPIYVGYGCNTRWRDHFSKRTNPHLNRWLKLYPETLPEFVAEGKTLDEAKALEIQLIAKFGRLDRGTGSLFNHTDGGDGASGLILSESAKQKIRDGATRRWNKVSEREKHSARMKAATTSVEFKVAILKRRGPDWKSAAQLKIEKKQKQKMERLNQVRTLIECGQKASAMQFANIQTESGFARFLKRHGLFQT